MKFKSIFLFFNMTFLLFLLILILLPSMMLGPDFPGRYWWLNWPLIILLGGILSAFNVFYAVNHRLFTLLEKENWPALVRYLEDRVIHKNRYSSRMLRLLVNSYLVLSDSAAVMSLENRVAIAKPALIDANALIFGTARILGKDISGAVRFFKTRKETVKPGLKEWVRWYHGFALLLDHRFQGAAEEFSLLARLSKDAVITGLSSYFLDQNIARTLGEGEQACREISSMGRERVLAALPARKTWDRETSRLSAEIHAAALSKYMEETGQWLYKTP